MFTSSFLFLCFIGGKIFFGIPFFTPKKTPRPGCVDYFGAYFRLFPLISRLFSLILALIFGAPRALSPPPGIGLFSKGFVWSTRFLGKEYLPWASPGPIGGGQPAAFFQLAAFFQPGGLPPSSGSLRKALLGTRGQVGLYFGIKVLYPEPHFKHYSSFLLKIATFLPALRPRFCLPRGIEARGRRLGDPLFVRLRVRESGPAPPRPPPRTESSLSILINPNYNPRAHPH